VELIRNTRLRRETSYVIRNYSIEDRWLLCTINYELFGYSIFLVSLYFFGNETGAFGCTIPNNPANRII
jgi:hypothetical protein